MGEQKQSCADLVKSKWINVQDELDILLQQVGYEMHIELDDDEEEEIHYDPWEALNEYALCFGYIDPETFHSAPYWRYQISWGGPQSEIRYYVNEKTANPYKTEFWYLDWHDGAAYNIDGSKTAETLWKWLSEARNLED